VERDIAIALLKEKNYMLMLNLSFLV